jgi:hypothetical protein
MKCPRHYVDLVPMNPHNFFTSEIRKCPVEGCYFTCRVNSKLPEFRF